MLSYLNSVDLDDPDLNIYLRQCFEVITHEPHKSIDDFLDSSSSYSPDKIISIKTNNNDNSNVTTPKEIDHPCIQEVEDYLKKELVSLTPKASSTKKQTFTKSLLLSLYTAVTAILNSKNKEGYFDQQVYISFYFYYCFLIEIVF